MNTINEAWKIVYDHVKVKYSEKFGGVTEWYALLEECDRAGMTGADVVKFAIDRLVQQNPVIVMLTEKSGNSAKINLFSNSENAQKYCIDQTDYFDFARIVQEDKMFDLCVF